MNLLVGKRSDWQSVWWWRCVAVLKRMLNEYKRQKLSWAEKLENEIKMFLWVPEGHDNKQPRFEKNLQANDLAHWQTSWTESVSSCMTDWLYVQLNILHKTVTQNFVHSYIQFIYSFNHLAVCLNKKKTRSFYLNENFSIHCFLFFFFFFFFTL